MEVEDGWVGVRSNTSSSPSSSSLIKTKGVAEMMHYRVELTSMWRVLHLTAMRCFEWEQGVFFHHQGGEGAGVSLSGHEVPINALHRMGIEIEMEMEMEEGMMKKSSNAMLLRDIVQDFTLSGGDSYWSCIV